MPPVGGSIESITIDGRTFGVAADAEVQRKLGGFENEIQANGDGTARQLKTRTPWALDGIVASIDDSNNDEEYLRGKADSNNNSVIAITFASGIVYQGEGQIVGEMQVSSANATASFSLMGPGGLTQQ